MTMRERGRGDLRLDEKGTYVASARRQLIFWMLDSQQTRRRVRCRSSNQKITRREDLGRPARVVAARACCRTASASSAKSTYVTSTLCPVVLGKLPVVVLMVLLPPRRLAMRLPVPALTP
ncbi:MAG: hypothetical protein WD794_08700 [Mycobacteriales bacterium]